MHTGLGVAWVGSFVFDSLVFGMTLFKFIILPRPNRVNIMDILFRDGELYLSINVFFEPKIISGAIYFGYASIFFSNSVPDEHIKRVMVVANLANVLTFMVREN